MIHNVYRDYDESMMYSVRQMKKNGHLLELHESGMISALILNFIRYYPEQTATIAPKLLQMSSLIVPSSGASHDE